MILPLPFASASSFRWLVGIAEIAAAAWIIVSLERWPYRERWAGPLLTDIGRSLRGARWTAAALGLSAVVSIWGLVVKSADGLASPDFNDYVFPVFISLCAIHTALLGHRSEIRDRGVLFHGRLIAWSRIELYGWTAGATAGRKTLEITPCRRVLRFLPPLRIPVAAEKQTTVQAAFDRYFREWPASGQYLGPSAAALSGSPEQFAPRCGGPWLVTSVLIFAALGAILVALLHGAAQESRQRQAELRTAYQAAASLNSDLSNGQYQRICQAAAPRAFSGATALACPEFLAGLRAKLGPLKAALGTRLWSAKSRFADGALDVSLDSETLYENGDAVEHLEYRVKSMEATLTRFGIDVRSPDRRENVETP